MNYAYSFFFQEFKIAFAQISPKFLVTATVPMDETIVSEGYNVHELTANLDLVLVVGYDLKRLYDNRADVHSPLNRTYGLSVVSSVGQNNA